MNWLNSFTFTPTVLLLLFVSLQWQISQLYAADAQTIQKEVAAYPATPEGVVEVFVKTYLDADDYPDSAITNKYFPNYEDIEANRTTHVIDPSKEWGTMTLDHIHIVTGFEIKEVKKSKNKATVKVLYKRLGRTLHPLIFKFDCTFPVAMKNKKDCKYLQITNDIKEETYQLAKPGKFWKIISLNEEYVSVSSNIKGLYRVKDGNDPRATHPSEKQKSRKENLKRR